MVSEIRNNVPWTKNDEKLLSDLPEADQKEVLDWIDENILPTKTSVYHGASSYGIKHLLRDDTGIYVTNNQFKHAMMIKGYIPYKEGELNWHYHISRKSKAFDYKARGFIA